MCVCVFFFVYIFVFKGLVVLECRILEKKRIWRHESSDVGVML